MSSKTPKATPTPIPALAPVLRPWSSGEGVVKFVVVAEVEAGTWVPVNVVVGVIREDVEVAVTVCDVLDAVGTSYVEMSAGFGAENSSSEGLGQVGTDTP